MQTFLVGESYTATAKCLDRQRLGKQRVEGYQILRTLLGETHGWARHLAVLMWAGYESDLWLYTRIMCAEWKERGYQDSISEKLTCLEQRYPDKLLLLPDIYPPWLLGTPLCASHRAALLAKDPAHYSRFGWTEEPDINYWWPTKHLDARQESPAQGG